MEKKKIDPAIEEIIKMLEVLAQKEAYDGIVPSEGAVPDLLLSVYLALLRKHLQEKRMAEEDGSKTATVKVKVSQKERWKDPEYRRRHLEGVRKKWADPVFRETRGRIVSQYMKKKCQDPAYMKVQSDGMKKQRADPTFNQACLKAVQKSNARRSKQSSEMMKKNHADPKFEAARIAALQKRMKEPDIAKLKAQQMKDRWKNPEFAKKSREASSQRFREKWKDPQFRKARIEQIKKWWANPDNVRLHVERMHKLFTDPAFMKKYSDLMRKRWEDPDWRYEQTEGRKHTNSISRYDFRKAQKSKGIGVNFDCRSRQWGPVDLKTPDKLLIEEERQEEISKAVASLPERQRVIVHLSFFEEKSHKEIYDMTGFSDDEIENALKEAYQTLASVLGQFRQ